MHPYLITTKPNRLQRAAKTARTWAARLLTGAGLLTLGLLVLTIRSLRAVISLLATLAARIELEISLRTGLPSVGASLGAGLTEAFMHEFRTGWKTTKEGHRVP